LFEPVTVRVGDYLLPVRNTRNTGVADDLLKLFFAAEVVANVVEIDLAVAFRFGILDQQ
jgi:hypothetical protein